MASNPRLVARGAAQEILDRFSERGVFDGMLDEAEIFDLLRRIIEDAIRECM